MVRHIKRKHSGLLDDIKEKTSCATNPTNIFSKNNNVSSTRKGPTDENDLVGSLYAAFKKGLTRQKMIKEMSDYFQQSSSITIYPLFSAVNNHAADLPIGFRTLTCSNCLTAPIDPIRLSDIAREGSAALSLIPRHVCNHEDLEIQRRRAENKIHLDVIKTWNELHQISIRGLANIVHSSIGPDAAVSIDAIEEVSLSSLIADSMPVCLGKVDENHWACRALCDNRRHKSAVINDIELMNILNLAKSTFAPFRAQINGKEHYFYIWIRLKSTTTGP